MKTQQFKDQVSSNFQTKSEELQKQINKLNDHRVWAIGKLNTLEIILDKILPSAFKAIDLEITKVEPVLYYNDNIDYSSSPTLGLTFTCSMIGRRKPYADTSYRSMNSTEQKRREDVRSKHETKFREISGYGCSINQFSLDKADRVLVTVNI